MAKRTQPDKYSHHRYYVYNDSEFEKKINDIKQIINKKYGAGWKMEADIIKLHNPITSEDRSETHIAIEFPKDHKLIDGDQETGGLIVELSKNYKIELRDIAYFMNGSYEKGTMYTANLRAYVSSNHKGLYIQVSPEATLDDVMEVWGDVEIWRMAFITGKFRGTRNKAPERPDLIYAIFRARKSGMTFTKIFDMYQANTLAHAKGSDTQFKSSDSLERYYRKYKPDS